MATLPNEEPRVVLFEPTRGKWLEFTSPRCILTTQQLEEVLPLLRQLEVAVAQEGVSAAGFIAYEAAPAFDASLPSKGAGDFPLLWFGLFQQVNELTCLPRASAGPLPADWRPSVNQDAYRQCLCAIRNHIREGDIYQVNFTYRLRTQTSMDPWQLFTQLAGHDETPYAAFVDTGAWAICSASPELFLRLDGELLESRPMKGTAARGLWYEDDRAKADALRASEKDRAENIMIVDMARNDLGRIAEAGSVQAPALFDVERHPTVWQMTSTVRAQTRASVTQILQAAFPPASITGAPKRRAMEIIAALESSPRQVYTGAIGFVAPGRRAQFNVAIRTVMINRASGEAEYGVGGGIVWDSQPEAELAECHVKARALRPVRRDFDLLETMRWSPKEGYWLLDEHLRRLAQSAEYFGFRVDLDRIRAELTARAASRTAACCRIRLLVSRQGGFRCEETPLTPAALRFGDIALAKAPIDAANVFLYHKTTCRELYEQAVQASPGSADVLLFNDKGEITESTVANVAFTIDGALVTPPVSCGLLPGTLRAALLKRGELRERVVTLEAATRATAVYLLNAVRGVRKIKVSENNKGTGTRMRRCPD